MGRLEQATQITRLKALMAYRKLAAVKKCLFFLYKCSNLHKLVDLLLCAFRLQEETVRIRALEDAASL